ncbi:hypothetical protein LTR60_001129 [Cryomyces antarcticus]|nr:hypothetical protein LTR39_000742 [Cryomyces antarcticus]KAK5019417.1 hypothetical protein LTR60_001129 [Cryomyces antarcticus]
MTTSLAILPSSPIYTQPSLPKLLVPTPPTRTRPKLSLNTAQIPNNTFGGKGSTSLRLETLSAVSPTVRNTFRNGHEETLSLALTSGRPPRPQLSINSSAQSQQPLKILTPTRTEPENTASASSYSSSESVTIVVPYTLAYNVTSILSNTPLPRRHTRRMSFTTTRPMFPAMKRVSFRTPLAEDIKTEKYTLAHSDIGSSSSSTISSIESSQSESSNAPSSPPQPGPEQEQNQDQDQGHDLKEATAERRAARRAPRTGDKRDSDESDSDTPPETPVAGRRKKSREWVWTLGPISKEQSSEDKDASNDEGS